MRLPMHHLNLDWDPQSWPDGCRSERAQVKIALVVIRDADQAMVSFGQFSFFSPSNHVEGEYEGEYDFRPDTLLFSSARAYLAPHADLYITRDAHVRRLELTLHHFVKPPPNVPDDPFLYPSQHYDIDEPQFRHVLSYLAGIHPAARASALATVESWFVLAERRNKWGAYARLREVENYIDQAVKDENHERVDQLNQVADALRALDNLRWRQ